MDSQLSVLKDRFIKLLNTIPVMVAHASVASNKLKLVLDSHADMYVGGDNC